MSEYFKFPSTKHVMLPRDENKRRDKAMPPDELAEMLSHEVVIEEKIDGANLGISFDENGKMLLQNRGDWVLYPLSGQWKKLGEWVTKRQDHLFDVLLDKYILFGEWCYATHSVYYDKLPDYFIGFDIYDKENLEFFSVERRNVFLEEMKIPIVHQCAKGQYSLKDLDSFWSKSYYGDSLCEGIYIRWDEGDWLKRRAKLVRYEFKQNIIEHWTRRKLKVNKIL